MDNDFREAIMSAVRVSAKYQITIPKKERDSLMITPGSKLRVFMYKNRLELVPEREIKDLRGFLKEINTKVERE